MRDNLIASGASNNTNAAEQRRLVQLWSIIGYCFAMQHFGFFEDWRSLGSPQKFGKSSIIVRFLMTDLLLIQTKLAPARPGPYIHKFCTVTQ